MYEHLIHVFTTFHQKSVNLAMKIYALLAFLNVKMYNYGKQNIIVNFIIKKLKKTQFPQKV